MIPAAAAGPQGAAWVNWVDLPVGPQPLPAWLRGLHIDWMEAVINPPRVTLKTRGDVLEWPNQVFRQEGSRYISESGDGRAVQYVYAGDLAWDAGREAWCSTQEGGYGGLCCPITMTGGRKVVLRGPWAGNAPQGYVEVSYCDTTDVYFRRLSDRGGGDRRPWWLKCTVAGLFLADDLLIRAVARFAPTCRIARIRANEDADTGLELVRGDWEIPKSFWGLLR